MRGPHAPAFSTGPCRVGRPPWFFSRPDSVDSRPALPLLRQIPCRPVKCRFFSRRGRRVITLSIQGRGYEIRSDLSHASGGRRRVRLERAGRADVSRKGNHHHRALFRRRRKRHDGAQDRGNRGQIATFFPAGHCGQHAHRQYPRRPAPCGGQQARRAHPAFAPHHVSERARLGHRALFLQRFRHDRPIADHAQLPHRPCGRALEKRHGAAGHRSPKRQAHCGGHFHYRRLRAHHF